MSHCARDQGRFWEMHERLFANQQSQEPWSAHAEALGLDVERFETCLEQGVHADAIRRDMAEAAKAGATGTPAFVLGLTRSDDSGRVEGLTFIRGAQSYSTFKTHIDSALADLADH